MPTSSTFSTSPKSGRSSTASSGTSSARDRTKGDQEDRERPLQKVRQSFGHNEKVTLEAVAPDLKATDAAAGARLFRNHILGKFGFPKHWYGGGGNVNRATASEMDTPALKMIQDRQNEGKWILDDMFTAQISRARKARYLRVGDDEATQYSIMTPPLGSKDIAQLGTMVQAVTASFVAAQTQGWIDKQTARNLYVMSVSFLGVDIDAAEVEANLEAERQRQGYQDISKSRTKPGSDGGTNPGAGPAKVIGLPSDDVAQGMGRQW